MSILFGHPGGNPNSHQAALAHFESGWLEAFCVPWIPTCGEIALLGRLPGLRSWSARLERRSFPPLLFAPRIEGKLGELWRMVRRILTPFLADESLSYQANDWLMRTMKRECHRPAVTAVHSYEDCSQWQFEEAKRLGKACIYDLPIGYYPWWEQKQAELVRKYSDWLPASGLPTSRHVRPEQKKREIALADLVLAPSTFARGTVEKFLDKEVAIAPYGVDLDFWFPSEVRFASRPVRFIYAGQSSLRKGTPMLIEAWEAAGLADATLELFGPWQLEPGRVAALPAGVTFHGPVSRSALRERYREADVFVFPSFFEGFGLVLLEAMACGLPAITTECTAGPDVLDDDCGRIIEAGNLEAFVASLRWFCQHRDRLPNMSKAARAAAEKRTWKGYRSHVREATAQFS